MAEIQENEINISSNITAYNQSPNNIPILSNYICIASDSTPTIYNQPQNTNIKNNISSKFDDSDNSLSDASFFSTLDDLKTATPQNSTYNRANQVDYKKFFQKKNIAAVKTNFSILLNFSHSKASYILFNYALNYLKEQSTHGFICIVQKKAKELTFDESSLKDAIIS